MAITGSNGTVTPAGTTTKNYRESQAYIIVPSLGYRIVSVTVDGGGVVATSPYTFNNIITNHTISAIFEISPLTVSISGPTSSQLNTSYSYSAIIAGGKTSHTYSWGSSSLQFFFL